ncbi:hypothetical protein Mal35_09290 [Gimesia maris]|uniref:hypothetical protein n=1 Tax=Gimesia maris TaxID=122 RepID=UPI00118B5CCC|nr:hypothetical protein [Gimesia maris]QDT77503.1 hypothetical protein Mal35_09290 [Gimesia maris]
MSNASKLQKSIVYDTGRLSRTVAAGITVIRHRKVNCWKDREQAWIRLFFTGFRQNQGEIIQGTQAGERDSMRGAADEPVVNMGCELKL